jgi:uncharacterized protein YkwD
MKGDILKKFVSIFLATVMMASRVVMAFAKPILKGDTNGDGKITAMDSRNILLVVTGKKTISKDERIYYDVNDSGLITAVDARMVLRMVVGLEEEITVEESTTKEPVTEESTTKEPVTEEPTTKEPVKEEPTTQKPVTEEISEKERMMRVLEAEFLRLVNEERVRNGRGELKVNEILHKAARLRAVECLEKFSHTRPNGESYKSILKGDLAYDWEHINENIAWFYESPYSVTDWTKVLTDADMKAFAKDFFYKFNNSSVHYDNILFRDFTETGFGVVITITDGGTLKVACSQLFGTPA